MNRPSKTWEGITNDQMGVSDGVCLEHYKFPGKDAANFWIFAIPCFQTPKNAFLTTMGSLITRPLNGGLPIYGLPPLKMSKQRSYGDGSKPIFTIGGSTSNQLFCCVPSGYQGFDHQFCCCNGVPQFQSNPSGSPHDM